MLPFVATEAPTAAPTEAPTTAQTPNLCDGHCEWQHKKAKAAQLGCHVNGLYVCKYGNIDRKALMGALRVAICLFICHLGTKLF